MWRWMCLLVLVIACDGQERQVDVVGSVREIGIEQAAELLKDAEIEVLDLRTPREFAAGHMIGARNIDFNNPGFREYLEALDRERPYLIHCASGNRSSRALPLFDELKFKKVYHLRRGLRGWVEAGYPAER